MEEYKPKKLFRYEYRGRHECFKCLRVYEFEITKTTPKGFWIDGDRWVSSEARKRFAYPTKTEALISFKARKRRQIRILEAQLNDAKYAFDQATEVQNEA